MKKILPILVLVSVLAVLIVPLMVSAAVAGPPECCKLRRAIDLGGGDSCAKDTVVAPTATATDDCGAGTETDCVTSKWGVFCFINSVNGVVDWIFVGLISLAVLFTLIGGILILTAGGDPAKVSTGRQWITYALIGLVVAFLARAIPAVMKLAMGY